MDKPQQEQLTPEQRISNDDLFDLINKPANNDPDALIEFELNKAEHEVDTGIIEYCIEVIFNPSDDHPVKKLQNHKILLQSTLCILSILFIAVIGSAVYAAAQDKEWNIRESAYEKVDELVKLIRSDLKSEAEYYGLDSEELVEELRSEGFSNVLIPVLLLEGRNWYLTEIEYQHSDIEYVAHIYFEGISGQKLRISVREAIPDSDYHLYFSEGSTPSLQFDKSDVKQVELIEVNGLDVTLYDIRGGENQAFFQDGDCWYIVVTNLEIEPLRDLMYTLK
ncbi:MAG: DUF4367 domain-containing protein [Clostridiales bacterium]|nr:DUF4367 domain-containing protein [Clostridiales bacterium]